MRPLHRVPFRVAAATRPSRGASLVEVALAIVVVTLLSVAVFSGVAASNRIFYENVHKKAARDVATSVAEELDRDGVPDPMPAPYRSEVIDGVTYTAEVSTVREGTDPREYYRATIVVSWGTTDQYEMETIVGVAR